MLREIAKAIQVSAIARTCFLPTPKSQQLFTVPLSFPKVKVICLSLLAGCQKLRIEPNYHVLIFKPERSFSYSYQHLEFFPKWFASKSNTIIEGLQDDIISYDYQVGSLLSNRCVHSSWLKQEKIKILKLECVASCSDQNGGHPPSIQKITNLTVYKSLKLFQCNDKN